MTEQKFNFIALILLLLLMVSLQNFETQNTQIESGDLKQKNQETKLFSSNSETNYQITNKYQRGDQLFYTQGLSFINSQVLLESAGGYSTSTISLLEFPSLKIIQSEKINSRYFGEGSSIIEIDGKTIIFMLTWQEKKVLKYDINLSHLSEIELPSEIQEGWGMTSMNYNNQQILIVSDGSNKIYHIDPQTFKITKVLHVVDHNNRPIRRINELEIVNNELLANIWMTNRIIKINPITGLLIEQYNMQDIIDDMQKQEGFEHYTQMFPDNCLNGIAYDKSKDRLLITGKNWPVIYEIKFQKKI